MKNGLMCQEEGTTREEFISKLIDDRKKIH
jgi:hypothetical protein